MKRETSHFRERARQGAVRSGSGRRAQAAWDGIGWRRHGVRARRFSCCHSTVLAVPPSAENAATWPRMRLGSEALR